MVAHILFIVGHCAERADRGAPEDDGLSLLDGDVIQIGEEFRYTVIKGVVIPAHGENRSRFVEIREHLPVYSVL